MDDEFDVTYVNLTDESINDINNALNKQNEAIEKHFDLLSEFLSSCKMFYASVSSLIHKTNDKSIIDEFEKLRLEESEDLNKMPMVLPLIPNDNNVPMSSQNAGSYELHTSAENNYEDEHHYELISNTSSTNNYENKQSEYEISALNKTQRKRKTKPMHDEEYINETKRNKTLTDSELLELLSKTYDPVFKFNSQFKIIPDVPENILDQNFKDFQIELGRHCNTMTSFHNHELLNCFRIGKWLEKAFYKYQSEKKYNKELPRTWDKWVEENVNLSIQATYDYRQFAYRFHNFQEIFKTGVPFYMFKKYGQRMVNVLRENNNYDHFFKHKK